MKTPRAATQESHGRVLVVDDEPRNRELLRDLLTSQGHQVIEAEDGIGAIGKATADDCDAILLDVMMPRMDGLEACRQLKANPDTAHIPVLMVTALAEREQRRQGVDAGANDYLTKPIDRQDVLLRVRNAIHAKRLHDNVQRKLEILRELERLRDNLTHMIVHDMRAPLMAIMGSFDLIRSAVEAKGDETMQLWQMGMGAAQELAGMCNGLLDVSRLEANQMPVKREACELLPIIAEAVTATRTQADFQGVSILTAGEPVSVSADRGLLHRILVNLITNAIKHTPERGTVTVRTALSGTAARIEVQDTGRGIAPEYHGKIFEKFGQVESRKDGQKHSAGLGLTFCKLAVEAHQGRIGVQSPSTGLRAGEVGKGSTFWFELPAIGADDGRKDRTRMGACHE